MIFVTVAVTENSLGCRGVKDEAEVSAAPCRTAQSPASDGYHSSSSKSSEANLCLRKFLSSTPAPSGPPPVEYGRKHVSAR
mmetsp:Transcript_18253/g.28338  ORF Transcript_18253/g.28338 Transcript_18253/m.28338 type:complete len:81 (+) Transcript_18253:3601-3843(+)